MPFRAIFVPTASRRTLVLETARMVVEAGELDLTADRLARQLGVSRSTLFRWIRADETLAAEIVQYWGPTHRGLSGIRKLAATPVS